MQHAFLAGSVVRLLAAQTVMGLAAVLVSGGVASWAGAASALIGACAYLLPNALFALRIRLDWAGRPNVATFFIGQFVKLVFTLAMLGLAARFAASWLVWWALLLGLVCVLKGYALLLLLRRLS